ncbi:MAG: twin-arginine translocase subunit TatC, partial [Limibacillus sp.]
FAAAFISCPIFLSQIWFFMAPGLYKHERSAFAPFLIASPILFFIGGALVYYLIMPMAWSFFLGFETPGGEGSLAPDARRAGTLELQVLVWLTISKRKS